MDRSLEVELRMAKKKPNTEPQSVTVTYDLFDQPTAQHKAGLAGLVLQIESMKARKFPKYVIPLVENLTPTSVRVTFSPESTQALFDDLYDAAIVEVTVSSKWPKKEPKRTEIVQDPKAKSDKPSKKTVYVYDAVQPRGAFLKQHLPDKDELWIKLWLDMLWAIPRGKPTTRGPYESRADGRSCSEGATVWQELLKMEKKRQRNEFHTAEVASALLLGAQAVNAESVPFQGRSEQNLLLHFWPLAVVTYVPQIVDSDGNGEFVGYTLAIPEVADLKQFCRLYPQMLRRLESRRRGFRPEGAIIDVPEQGALEFMDHLAELAQKLAGGLALSNWLSAIEFFHMAKLGKNIKTVAAGRVVPREGIIDGYRGIKRNYRNPLFRGALLLALLRDDRWYACLPNLLAQRDWTFFVRSDGTPAKLPWFSADAAQKFANIQKDTQTLEAQPMTTSDGSDKPRKPASPLELIVQRMVQNYVWRKTEAKCGKKYEDFKGNKVKDDKGNERIQFPPDYLEARQKVCSDAFLAFRSRRDQDFVDYFTATVCSVGQFLPPDDYQLVASALLGTNAEYQPEDVKTLAMLAISACS